MLFFLELIFLEIELATMFQRINLFATALVALFLFVGDEQVYSMGHFGRALEVGGPCRNPTLCSNFHAQLNRRLEPREPDEDQPATPPSFMIQPGAQSFRGSRWDDAAGRNININVLSNIPFVDLIRASRGELPGSESRVTPPRWRPSNAVVWAVNNVPHYVRAASVLVGKK